MTDSVGAVVERCRYDAYGKRTVTNAAGTPIAASTIGQQRGFTGYYLDAETGLYYARARMYSAGLGRFASRDPLGDAVSNSRPGAAYSDGYGLYSAYFIPNKIDPTGMWACMPACEFQVQSAVNNGTVFQHNWNQALAECEAHRQQSCSNYGGFNCESDCSSQCVSQGATIGSGMSRCLSLCGEWKAANCRVPPGSGLWKCSGPCCSKSICTECCNAWIIVCLATCVRIPLLGKYCAVGCLAAGLACRLTCRNCPEP